LVKLIVNYLVIFTLLRHQYPAVGHILTRLVNSAFDPKSGFKNKSRARARFKIVNFGSGRVRASKWGPVTTQLGTLSATQRALQMKAWFQKRFFCLSNHN